MSYYSHPTALIDDHVTIGAGTKIWSFTHVSEGAVIGNHCILGQNVFVDKHVVIGNGVKIQNNVSVYAGVVCEDDVFLGPSVVFTNVINPRSAIERKDQIRKTLVQKGASIGANATIVCGISIGAYAMIGAGTVVTKDVPAFALMKGNPGRLSGWISKAGHPLHFDTAGKAACPETGEQYALQQDRVQCLDDTLL